MLSPPVRRLAAMRDIAAVHAIYMHPEVIPYLGIDPCSLEEFEPYFKGLLTGDSFFVVLRHGDVRGYYRATRQQGRSRHVVIVTTLAISPAEKGSGFARAMIEDAIERMRADGVLRVELTLEADNARAFAFYRKLGFEQEGRLRRGYKRSHEPDYCDEIVMARWLG